MSVERLSLAHKGLLRDRLRIINSRISEYSFANIYLFRDIHKYEVISEKEIFIRGASYDGYTYLMPTAELKQTDPDYYRGLLSSVDFLFPVPEEWLRIFDEKSFDFSHRTGDMDYIYTVEKMSTLRGRNLHQKRNLLRRFSEGYKHEALPLSNDRIGHARYILDEWQKESGTDSGDTDYVPCMEALRLYEDLVLCGGIYYADDEPAGFVLGEELNNETFVLHFAKARKKFRGIYQFMFNNFAKILPASYRYLNLEQDLDKETLRIAKSSYLPDHMVKKVRVGLKKG